MTKATKVFSIIMVILLVLSVGLLSVAVAFAYRDNAGHYLPASTETYTFKGADLMDNTVMGLPAILPIIDGEKSYIELKDNGVFTLKFIINADVINAVIKNIDLNDLLKGLDIEGMFAIYGAQLFPGADLNDLAGSFKLISDSLGAKLCGVDFTTPEGKLIQDVVTKKRPIPVDFRVPKDIGIEVNAPYFMKTVHSDTSGDHIGVYAGKHDSDSDSFLILTKFVDKKGVTKLSLRIEFVQLFITALLVE